MKELFRVTWGNGYVIHIFNANEGQQNFDLLKDYG